MITLAAPLFGTKHLLGLLGITIIFIIFSGFLSKKTTKNYKKVILIFTLIFYILEIMKLSYITYNNQAFPIYHLPFHLCSLPLYLYPLMYFMKPGSFIDTYVKPTAYSVCLLAGILALVMPTTIIGNAESWVPFSENVLPIISFLYHGTMIFSSIYLIKSGFYKLENNQFVKIILVSLSYAFIAILVNHFLDTDFMMLNRGIGSPLIFLMETSRALYIGVTIFLGIDIIGLGFFLTSKILSIKFKTQNIKTQ